MGTKKAKAGDDVVLIHGVTEDQQGYHVLRRRNRRIEMGAIRPLRHAQPIHGEVVRLKPRGEFPLLFDVDVQHSTAKQEQASSSQTAEANPESRGSGPPMVASETYRVGWDAIWGHKRSRKQRMLN